MSVTKIQILTTVLFLAATASAQVKVYFENALNSDLIQIKDLELTFDKNETDSETNTDYLVVKSETKFSVESTLFQRTDVRVSGRSDTVVFLLPKVIELEEVFIDKSPPRFKRNRIEKLKPDQYTFLLLENQKLTRTFRTKIKSLSGIVLKAYISSELEADLKFAITNAVTRKVLWSDIQHIVVKKGKQDFVVKTDMLEINPNDIYTFSIELLKIPEHENYKKNISFLMSKTKNATTSFVRDCSEHFSKNELLDVNLYLEILSN
ncbi:hypothetical protein [Flavobacterium sp.]|uniref:hypothetical protein n=1 Tax=Flavobacterium sp. TaxID=239 RepID=UPI00262C6A12|nr:hypothetical protein [Flavobacterium sp.]